MKKVDAESLVAVHTHTHTHTHTIHLLTKVSLLNIARILSLCLLICESKYLNNKTEIKPI